MNEAISEDGAGDLDQAVATFRSFVFCQLSTNALDTGNISVTMAGGTRKSQLTLLSCIATVAGSLHCHTWQDTVNVGLNQPKLRKSVSYCACGARAHVSIFIERRREIVDVC